ncbi:phage tail terminator-like protein [Acinetobacter sp. SA01]|uniref:phage tail terminator-like protein n=1 Tax=Acinetobacter sp. SA01 TaxID=1862567 RepID=UPI00140A1900|nr:phage tail terminator-like protein [Acinetobacter sp. SA01]
MNLTQAEQAIYGRIGTFNYTGLDKANIRIENQKGVFTAPTDKPWCRASIQYADSQIVGVGNGPCKRNYGIIQIQCFIPKGTGTLGMTSLCDAWDSHLQSFQSSHLEIYKVHAPQSIDDNDFYAKLIRAEFQVN